MDIFKPYGAVPSQRQMAHYHFEKKAFFHFGINTFTDNSAEIEFGGIYPFNTLTFNGTGLNRYSIDVFDGAQYRTVYNSRSPHKNQIVTFDKSYSNSYKIRFNSQKKTINPETIDIKVFEI